MAVDLDVVAARILTRRYLFALAMVAALSVASQVLIQRYLLHQRDDARVVNLAGRQRMLSQEAVKAALAWQLATEARDTVGQQQYRSELTRVLDEWEAAQDRLMHSTDSPDIGAHNSPTIAAALTAIVPSFQAIERTARHLAPEHGREGVERLLRDEPMFLRQMEAIVDLYGRESLQRVRRLVLLEVGFCGILLAVLVAEALVVFRPAIRWLRQALRDQARLQDEALVHREAAVSEEVARNIGYDLHDGVGQALTALSLQAKNLENSLKGHTAASVVLQMRQSIADGLVQVRSAARRLAPMDVRSHGLEHALQALVEATEAVPGISCQMDCRLALPPDRAQDLLHITQEAVANALRHGDGPDRHIHITLVPERDLGVLTVRDDGRSRAGQMAPGMGLRSMRYRAQRLGGDLEAGHHPDGGWVVCCRFPLDPVPR